MSDKKEAMRIDIINLQRDIISFPPNSPYRKKLEERMTKLKEQLGENINPVKILQTAQNVSKHIYYMKTQPVGKKIRKRLKRQHER